MTDQRFDADNVVDQDRRPRQYCLAPIAAAAPAAVAGLLLAVAEPSPPIVAILTVGLWFWLVLSVAAVIVAIARAVRLTVDQPAVSNPLYFMPRISRPCAWASVGLLAVAAGGLFAGGEQALGMGFEVFMLFALIVSTAPDSTFGPKNHDDAFGKDYTPITSGRGALRLAGTAGAVWLALGSPPDWTENMILTWFWFVSIGMAAGTFVTAFALTAVRWMERRQPRALRRRDESARRPQTAEPPRTGGQQINIWFWRASWAVGVWALWAGGQPLLAGLLLLAWVLTLTTTTHVRRLKHGESPRIDVLARAVHFIVWRPLAVTAIVVGTPVAVAIFLPLSIVGTIYHLIAGKTPTSAPHESERDARVRKARIRRAAASYRLREAFGRPDGFVYFMCSEPHQQKHFLGPGGPLAGLGDHVVARDYRRDVLETRNIFKWVAFEQAPEGALLHVNRVSNMRRDLPFVAVVPPHGRVQTFRLSEPYRARSRDKGAALREAEKEIRAAIAAAGL